MITNFDHLTHYYGDEFKEMLERIGEASNANDYIKGHIGRLVVSILEIKRFVPPGARILEVGFSNFFHKYIAKDVGAWDYTTFAEQSSQKVLKGVCSNDVKNIYDSTEIRINLEEEEFPSDFFSAYDVVLLTEVIEHMEKDPMWLMQEINKILKMNGKLFITTPNSIGARIFWKVAHGYHPSFFMKYSKNRALYRHNYEFTPSNLKELVVSAGFSIDTLMTLDTFEDPFNDGYKLLASLNLPLLNRGDNILCLANKSSDVVERYPAFLYT